MFANISRASINTYYEGLKEKGLYNARDPNSVEAQAAAAELEDLRMQNKAILAYYDGLPREEDPEAAAAAIQQTIDNKLDALRQSANQEPDMLDTSKP